MEHCTALTEDALGRFQLLHWSERPVTLGHVTAGGVQASPERVPALRPLAALGRISALD